MTASSTAASLTAIDAAIERLGEVPANASGDELLQTFTTFARAVLAERSYQLGDGDVTEALVDASHTRADTHSLRSASCAHSTYAHHSSMNST